MDNATALQAYLQAVAAEFGGSLPEDAWHLYQRNGLTPAEAAAQHRAALAPEPVEIEVHTRPDGYVDVVANGTRFVVFPALPSGTRFMTAHDDEWASVPVGNFPSLGAAIDRTLQPFTFPIPAAKRHG